MVILSDEKERLSDPENKLEKHSSNHLCWLCCCPLYCSLSRTCSLFLLLALLSSGLCSYRYLLLPPRSRKGRRRVASLYLNIHLTQLKQSRVVASCGIVMTWKNCLQLFGGYSRARNTNARKLSTNQCPLNWLIFIAICIELLNNEFWFGDLYFGAFGPSRKRYSPISRTCFLLNEKMT